mmetsp:Transcript_1905/g.3060  ORF Transcript_1905/g.3060 Transcript_1905/m.3060 type:complete len:202 (+) Transcript_1905:158-763(+)
MLVLFEGGLPFVVLESFAGSTPSVRLKGLLDSEEAAGARVLAELSAQDTSAIIGRRGVDVDISSHDAGVKVLHHLAIFVRLRSVALENGLNSSSEKHRGSFRGLRSNEIFDVGLKLARYSGGGSLIVHQKGTSVKAFESVVVCSSIDRCYPGGLYNNLLWRVDFLTSCRANGLKSITLFCCVVVGYIVVFRIREVGACVTL